MFAIYTYIDPPNHSLQLIGKYGSPISRVWDKRCCSCKGRVGHEGPLIMIEILQYITQSSFPGSKATGFRFSGSRAQTTTDMAQTRSHPPKTPGAGNQNQS